MRVQYTFCYRKRGEKNVENEKQAQFKEISQLNAKACLNDTEDGLVNWPFPCLDSGRFVF